MLCTIGSITASEFFEAGRNGLRPQFRANVFVGDYQGEVEAEYQGATYGIYRTYCPKDDTVELYLERKAGS
nr:MAG TPA: head closure knob [Caudoviricetes sp.]